MVKISISLVLEKQFPGRKKATISDQEIDAIQRIDLSYCSIDSIDNLEVFSDIKELILIGNHITIIENILFLPQLELLDVSENQIADIESLCIGFITCCSLCTAEFTLYLILN